MLFSFITLLSSSVIDRTLWTLYFTEHKRYDTGVNSEDKCNNDNLLKSENNGKIHLEIQIKILYICWTSNVL